MEKEYFVKTKTKLQEEIKTLQDQLKDLEKTYIETNQKFPIGSKVSITTFVERFSRETGKSRLIPEEKHYSFIIGYTILANDDVQPILMKAKKDGTISKYRDLLLFKKVKIELA